YLLDPLGRLRFTYPYGTPPADMAHDLRLLLTREG
ncbi:MAG: SCO family protein, partial [Clostridia bacterium]|nr:SCO family protein [Clostridia bacterium]